MCGSHAGSKLKPMPTTDNDLIQACRAGDTTAWERLLDKYERLVYSIALNQGATAEDAADVTQITFTILMQSLDDLRDDSNLAAWLGTVARRHTWRLLKRRRREPTGPEEDVAADPSARETSTANSAIARWEQIEWIEYGLNLLDERCRQLLLALYFDPDEPSYVDVADRLDMAVGSVGPTRARCLERMRRHLDWNGSVSAH